MRRSRPHSYLVPGLALLLAAVLLLPSGAEAASTGAGSFDEPESPDSDARDEPLRLAIAGLVHGHVHGVLGDLDDRSDIRLVGLWEEDPSVRAQRRRQYELPDSLMFADLRTMLEETGAEAVAAFTATADHPRVVEAAAPLGIHVMMEKPLAVDLEHGRRILAARDRHEVHVIVNYETTWYPSNQTVHRQVHAENRIGPLRKVVVRDGHEGPREIGVSDVFLDWLLDPERNGAGALYDFGCYGANLITWLMEGRRPDAVTAVTQRMKSDPAYSEVDDEATILLEYPETQGIVQASWNWPYSIKNMSVFGAEGALFAETPTDLYHRTDTTSRQRLETPRSPSPRTGSLTYLRAVARGVIEPDGLSSLENNLIVNEILAAARRSARTGETIELPEESPYE